MSPQGPGPTVGSGGVAGAGGPGVSRCPVHGISCWVAGGRERGREGRPRSAHLRQVQLRPSLSRPGVRDPLRQGPHEPPQSPQPPTNRSSCSFLQPEGNRGITASSIRVVGTGLHLAG